LTERGAGVSRAARSAVLDLAVGPGFRSIDEARFARNVRFVDGTMTATSAAARYVLDQGVLELTGSEPGSLVPHVVNDQVLIDAVRIDVTLDGPVVVASGSVKSVLQPRSQDPSKRRSGDAEVRMPAMLKQDQPVNVTAANLTFDGRRSVAKYDGAAQLWQGDTLIKAPRLEMDGDTGNLSADGSVATVSTLVQEGKDGRKERVPSRGTAKAFAYEDATRRATYTGDAHLSGPQGDLTANRIELFLKPSGDELDRVEAYETVSLRSDTQKTTGVRLTYFGDEGRYLVRGSPVTIVDDCGRTTNGRTLTFFKSTDRIVVDGNEQIRTQSTGKSNCPGQ
jgi:lipopolysaccharide transport protein LptA